MGLTITSAYKGAPSLDGGYGMLKTIREEVAINYDKEFGEHYAKLGFLSEEGQKAWNKKAKEILAAARFKNEDADLINFLFMSDCDGRINYKTCKKVYDLIKDTKNKRCLRYAFYSKNDWEDLKTLLLGCYSHHSFLKWS